MNEAQTRHFNQTQNVPLYQRWSREATIQQVVRLGLPFSVGGWTPVSFSEPRLRLRWRWGHAWEVL